MRTNLVAAGLSLSLFVISSSPGQCFSPPEVLTPALATGSSMTWWDSDGEGPLPPKLVVSTGGLRLGAIGGVSARFAAAWDGERWESLDADMGDRLVDVDAVGTVNGELYIAGLAEFGSGPPWPNRVLKWNGSGWQTVADTPIHVIRRIVSWRGRPVISNLFPPCQIAAFDGTSFVPLGNAFSSEAIEVVEYAGDLFAITITDRRLLRWNGTSWEPFGPNVVPTCAAVFGDSLYVGGSFGNVQGIPGSSRLLRWNGTAWSGVGGGFVGSTVSALSATGSALLAVGRFSSAGGVPAMNVAAWDGNQWRSAAEPGAVAEDYSTASVANQFIASSGDQVALRARRIRVSGGTTIESLVLGIWDGAAWLPVGSRGMSSRPTAVCEHDGSIYVGGAFNYADGPSAGFARLSGDRFEAVGPIRGTVSVMESGPNALLVAGQIALDDSTPAWRVASLDGETWSTLGGSWNQSVNAIHADDAGLYIGGSFTVYNNASLRYLARWDGTTWTSAPGGYSGSSVGALTRFGGELIAGESSAAGAIYAFNGTNWRRLGTSFGPVRALAIYNNELFVGMDTDNGLRRWNGTEWVPVNRSGRVTFLRQRNGILYFGDTNTTRAYRDGAILASPGTLLLPFASLGDDVYSIGNFFGAPGAPAGVFARIPSPCLADYNRDGMVDAFDYDDFVACFEGGACPEGRSADADGNGFVDFFDYAEFVAQFSAGC